MSVIVKDMMLPDCCAVCELTDSDDGGIYCNVLEKYMRFDELPKGRRTDCPIFDENVKTIQSIVINDRYGNVAEYAKVTRCKDCKFYEVAELNYDGTPDKRCKPSICANGWYEYAVERDPNWFCADAEPKENENGK